MALPENAKYIYKARSVGRISDGSNINRYELYDADIKLCGISECTVQQIKELLIDREDIESVSFEWLRNNNAL